jgi:hypothetical protein
MWIINNYDCFNILSTFLSTLYPPGIIRGFLLFSTFPDKLLQLRIDNI